MRHCTSSSIKYRVCPLGHMLLVKSFFSHLSQLNKSHSLQYLPEDCCSLHNWHSSIILRHFLVWRLGHFRPYITVEVHFEQKQYSHSSHSQPLLSSEHFRQGLILVFHSASCPLKHISGFGLSDIHFLHIEY
jgi:hypothetical protein